MRGKWWICCPAGGAVEYDSICSRIIDRWWNMSRPHLRRVCRPWLPVVVSSAISRNTLVALCWLISVVAFRARSISVGQHETVVSTDPLAHCGLRYVGAAVLWWRRANAQSLSLKWRRRRSYGHCACICSTRTVLPPCRCIMLVLSVIHWASWLCDRHYFAHNESQCD